MASSDERFEIAGCDARGWSIAGVCETEAEAVEQAHERRRGGYAAVRVLRVSYEEESGGYQEREILFLGDRHRTPAMDSGKREDAGPLCATLSDFYTPRSRRAIKRLLGDWLARMNLTAVELLHHPEYVGKLENSGTALQGAVQRAAIAQGRTSGRNVQERMREIFNVCDKAAARLRLDARSGKLPRIVDGDVESVLAKLPPTAERPYLFCVALTDWIRHGKTLGAKLAALIELLPRTESEALALMDPYMADFVEDAAALTELLGPMPNLGAAVLRIADVAQGRVPPEADAADPLAALAAHIAAGRLPRCRDALIRRLAGTLRGSRELTDGGPVAEITFNQELRRSLVTPAGEMIGGEELADAFHTRVERHLHPEGIGRLLERLSSPIDRINRLLDIEPGVPPGGQKNRLGEYVLPIVMLPANEALFVDGKQPLAERLRALAQLQRRIAASGFNETMRSKASAKLDEYCVNLVRSSGLLDKIERSADRIPDKGLAILKLCSAGLFTEGQALDAAHRVALRYLKHPAFLPAYLGGGDEQSKRQRLMTLRQLLDEAGLGDLLGALQPSRAAAGLV
jgi:hypothetical protein